MNIPLDAIDTSHYDNNKEIVLSAWDLVRKKVYVSTTNAQIKKMHNGYQSQINNGQNDKLKERYRKIYCDLINSDVDQYVEMAKLGFTDLYSNFCSGVAELHVLRSVLYGEVIPCLSENPKSYKSYMDFRRS